MLVSTMKDLTAKVFDDYTVYCQSFAAKLSKCIIPFHSYTSLVRVWVWRWSSWSGLSLGRWWALGWPEYHRRWRRELSTRIGESEAVISGRGILGVLEWFTQGGEVFVYIGQTLENEGNTNGTGGASPVVRQPLFCRTLCPGWGQWITRIAPGSVGLILWVTAWCQPRLLL